MKIHLIRSEEISTSRFGTIADIIQRFKGPMEFCIREEDVSVDDDNPDYVIQQGQDKDKSILKILSWDTLFGYCRDYRKRNGIPDEDYLVLFTDHGNEKNWFSSWDPSGKFNFFIQTSGWDKYIEGEPYYPVIYELATLPLYATTASNLEETLDLAHKDHRGCPFDMCGKKVDIRLRLRTGDICPECRARLLGKNLDPLLAKQVFSIIDHIRNQMLYRDMLLLTSPSRRLLTCPSRMEIIKFSRKLKFPDLGDIQVKLSPREITVYLFFYLHEEGVAFKEIPDFREELRIIYGNFSSDANMTKFTNTIDAIACKGGNTDTLSEMVSTVNKKIRETIYPEIVENYVISGEKAQPRKILVDRKLVTLTGDPIPIKRRHK